MITWLVVLAVGVGTYAYRAALFVVLGGRALPAWSERPLSLVGPAAIGALAAGMLLTDHGRFAPAGGVELLAAAAAFVTVRRSGDVSRGLLAGFACLWVLGPLIG